MTNRDCCSTSRHLFSRRNAALLPAVVVALHAVLGASPVSAADFAVQQWQCVEIQLISAKTYTDPFQNVDVTATFTGPGNEKIARPAFWDGNLVWKVRFAPTQAGLWTMKTSATDTTNAGLHGISKTVQCDAYTGNLDIYKHGFLKVSSNGRYLVCADGTPFFYLGDTHWILPHERFSTSNAPGVASQFKYVVDKRVAQKFTVYQSEPIWQPHGGTHTAADEEVVANLTDGMTSADLGGFANLDRKFKYIADQGLVHANAQIDWAQNPANYPVYTEAYMTRLARYWVARYGAYPVIWTIAQEIDKNMYGAFNEETIKKWYAVGQSISDNDAYNHPLMPHMENTGETPLWDSWWSNKPYHDGWAIQGEADMGLAKSYWNTLPTKPMVVYEAAYDNFWTDSRGALATGYKSFQCGQYGYGYGANGVWNDIYSKSGDPADFGTAYEMPARYYWWYDGANLTTGDQLTYFRNFYTSLEWWKLTPRFDDAKGGAFANASQSLLSSDSQSTFVVFFFGSGTATGTLKNLVIGSTYIARWFNPRDGKYTAIATFTPSSASWTIPVRPTAADWVLLVQKSGITGSDPKIKSTVRDILATQISARPSSNKGSTSITISLREPSRAQVTIVDSQGRMVKNLGLATYAAGTHTFTWSASHQSNGIYYAVLKAAGRTFRQKIELVE